MLFSFLLFERREIERSFISSLTNSWRTSFTRDGIEKVSFEKRVFRSKTCLCVIYFEHSLYSFALRTRKRRARLRKRDDQHSKKKPDREMQMPRSKRAEMV